MAANIVCAAVFTDTVLICRRRPLVYFVNALA